MIGLWHRWFDAREHRKARERAEAAYSRLLVRYTALAAEPALDPVDDADLRRKDERIEELARNLVNSERATKAALDRADALARQLDDVQSSAKSAVGTATRIADGARDVRRLPWNDHDRANANRLQRENERLRRQAEHCEKEHYR